MASNIPESERRVFIGVTIHPNSKKFLKSMRAKNIGRAIDNLVTHHQAFLSALQKRPNANIPTIPSGPSVLDMPEN